MTNPKLQEDGAPLLEGNSDAALPPPEQEPTQAEIDQEYWERERARESAREQYLWWLRGYRF